MPDKKNAVTFKGGKNGINVVLKNGVDFEELKDLLKQKLSDAHEFFDGAKKAVSFSGRKLTCDEEAELVKIISSGSKLDISYIGESKKEEPGIAKTYYHNGGLRNGQVIKYSGSVVLIGDVNPGGEIIAEGNIIVLGTLKGIVHAGCSGNEGCFVAALCLQPTQLRIAGIITYIPKPEKSLPKKLARSMAAPAYAYINEGRIFVEPLTN